MKKDLKPFYGMKIYPLKKQFSILAICLILFSLTAKAQYTLQDKDVVVENGIIKSCSYDFTEKSIIIPQILDGQTVISIDDYPSNGVFEYKGITAVQLPATLCDIGGWAFANNEITSITIPDSVYNIGSYAFTNNKIENLVIPNYVMYIGIEAFRNNGLKSLTFESNSLLREVRMNSFANNSLTNVIIPDGVFEIEWGAFCNNSLTSVVLSESIQTINGAAFNNNAINLVNGKPSEGIIYARNINGTTDSTIIVSYGGASDTIDFIPDNVTYIYWSAFCENSLTNVTIPKKVVQIGNNAFGKNSIKKVNFEANSNIRMISSYAFQENSELSGIILPANVNAGFSGYKDENGNKLNVGDTIKDFSLLYVAEMPAYTITIDDVTFINGGIQNFTGYTNGYANIIIPDNFNGIPVTFIWEDSFRDKELMKVTLPNSLTYIGSWAFYNNKIDTIIIPNRVSHIGSMAYESNHISSIALPNPVVKEGYVFNEWQDYNGAVVTEITDLNSTCEAQLTLTGYLVSGKVYIDDIDGLLINISGDITAISFTDYSGLYSFALDAGRSITITPTMDGYTFSPESITINTIRANTSDLNFEAISVSVHGISEDNTIKVFPNPASDIVTIEAPNEINSIEVYTSLGEKIWENSQAMECKTMVNMNEYQQGIYFILIKSNNFNYTKKIIKN